MGLFGFKLQRHFPPWRIGGSCRGGRSLRYGPVGVIPTADLFLDTFDKLRQGSTQFSVVLVKNGSPCHHNIVNGTTRFAGDPGTEIFPNQSFHTIPVHSMTQLLLCNRQSQAGRADGVRRTPTENGKETIRGFYRTGENPGKIAGFEQAMLT